MRAETKYDTNREEVLKIVRSAKSTGLTAAQIALRTGKSRRHINQVFIDLAQENLVAKAGYRRGNSNVWVALDTHDSGPVNPGVPIV
jgi:ribosomal protein L17